MRTSTCVSTKLATRRLTLVRKGSAAPRRLSVSITFCQRNGLNQDVSGLRINIARCSTRAVLFSDIL